MAILDLFLYVWIPGRNHIPLLGLELKRFEKPCPFKSLFSSPLLFLHLSAPVPSSVALYVLFLWLSLSPLYLTLFILSYLLSIPVWGYGHQYSLYQTLILSLHPCLRVLPDRSLTLSIPLSPYITSSRSFSDSLNLSVPSFLFALSHSISLHANLSLHMLFLSLSNCIFVPLPPYLSVFLCCMSSTPFLHPST